MSIYIISDLHVGFAVDKPMNVFGDHWEDHHIKIEEDWQSRVTKEDTVIIAGDTSWGIDLKEATPDMEWIKSMNGKKIMSKGNHDYFWTSMKKLNEHFPYISFLQNNSYIVENIGIIGTRGWLHPKSGDVKEEDIKIYNRECSRLKLSMEDLKKQKGYENLDRIFCILHYPPFLDAQNGGEIVGIIEEFNRKEEIKITNCYFGHVHSHHDRVFQGVVNGIEYKMITCDYTDFKLTKIKD